VSYGYVSTTPLIRTSAELYWLTTIRPDGRPHVTPARIADAYQAKYGPAWRFAARDGHLHSAGGPAIAYRVAPATAYGFGKSTPSQTRWTFSRAELTEQR
jgi:hypothetical protein